MTKIKLNDLKFRYDVYQIANLFYDSNDIEFIEESYDFYVQINLQSVVCGDELISIQTQVLENSSVKELLKKTVFKYLYEKTGDELPWGTLVGIRPSKIALALINQGLSENTIVEYYDEHYLTRKDKAKLCIEVAKLEKAEVNGETNTISVYIGMPFCPTRCSYCSFTSNSIVGCAGLVEPYLKALKHEIKSLSEYINLKSLKIQNVYFGGGTPTSISEDQFEELMKIIYGEFIENKNIREFTVECGRADSITKKKLEVMKKYGVHRISINPQTMNDETLKQIGRSHSALDVINSFNLAREMGFNDINMDIIIGLPGEGIEHVRRTCAEIFKLKPDNITVHGMSIKRSSKLHESFLKNDKTKKLTQSEINSMYEASAELSKQLNMKPYYMYKQKNMFGNMENVGYCTQLKEGIYNIQMIEEKQTIIALGADAVTKVIFLKENRIERAANVKDLREYINRIDEMISRKINLLNTLY